MPGDAIPNTFAARSMRCRRGSGRCYRRFYFRDRKLIRLGIGLVPNPEGYRDADDLVGVPACGYGNSAFWTYYRQYGNYGRNFRIANDREIEDRCDLNVLITRNAHRFATETVQIRACSLNNPSLTRSNIRESWVSQRRSYVSSSEAFVICVGVPPPLETTHSVDAPQKLRSFLILRGRSENVA